MKENDFTNLLPNIRLSDVLDIGTFTDIIKILIEQFLKVSELKFQQLLIVLSRLMSQTHWRQNKNTPAFKNCRTGLHVVARAMHRVGSTPNIGTLSPT